MNCKYFGECGACTLYAYGYETQLEDKKNFNKKRFSSYYSGDISVYKSPESHYRSRSEFKIWHVENEIHYAMNHISKKGIVLVDECPQVNQHIATLMPKLLKAIKKNDIDFKLFGADFLSSSSGELVVSLLYHRKLDEKWQIKATNISKEFGINIIGRSRKQKLTIGQDFVTETLYIDNESYKFNHIENSFTQPNPRVNEQMISWAIKNLSNIEGDLLELYCGAGNFTIPFCKKFNRVLATEISKTSINAAKANMILNNVENIEFVRMSVEEFVQALDGVREFRRMKEVNLDEYDLNTIFVDPPRSGLDKISSEFVSRYEHILYISCNPETLFRDIEFLNKSHKIIDMAIFDQFPYTPHVEMGVKFIRKVTA